MLQDPVDLIVKQWNEQRPDLDCSEMAVVGRISRLARTLERRLNVTFHKFGLHSWEFDLLATLRRSGPPFALTPTEMVDSLMVTTSTITNRIDRLEAAGLVDRMLKATNDRRQVLVKLTAQGFQLVNEALEAHVETERELLSGLTEQEQELLTELLRKLSLSLLNPQSTTTAGRDVTTTAGHDGSTTTTTTSPNHKTGR